MSLGVFLINLVVFGLATGASINGTSSLNETTRSGRTYDEPSPFLRIPVGYYKPPQDESSTGTESEEDTPPRRDVPTSFDDFIPSDRRTPSTYPTYYADKGKNVPPPPKNWKGDWASGHSTPSWMPPTPADMAMMVNMMKEMNEVQSPDNGPLGFLSKLISDPATAIGAILLPAAIILGVLIPLLIPLFTNPNTGNTPTVSTTATGGKKARKLGDNPSFVKPILEAIENFGSRSMSENTCLQKSFCEATRSSNNTDFRPIQRSIYKAFTFVDDHWLETLGVKQLMDAMGTGNCDTIQCSAAVTKGSDYKKKQA